MAATDDYCELCDLPRSQCIHGQPPPVAPAKASPPPRRRAATPARSTGRAGAAKVTAKPAVRRWTPPEVLSPVIVEVLGEAGGELPADELFDRLGAIVGGQLRSGDQELTPEGELRWHYAARRARQALIADGVMTKGAPGVWKLA